MKIGELSRATGITASRIRFYESHGLLPAAERNGNGYRDYLPSTVERLTFIKQAQSLGFSLSEIKAGMPASTESMRACDQVLEPLCAKLAEVDEQIRQLRERRDIMAGMISRLQAKQAAQNPGLQCRQLRGLASSRQRRQRFGT